MNQNFVDGRYYVLDSDDNVIGDENGYNTENDSINVAISTFGDSWREECWIARGEQQEWNVELMWYDGITL